MHMCISFAGIRTNFILFARPVLLCWSFVLLGGVASFKFNYFSETAFEQKNVAMTGRHAYNPSTYLPPCLPFYNPSEERPLCLPFYNPSEEWPPYCLPFYNPIVRNGRHVYPSKMVCLTIFLPPPPVCAVWIYINHILDNLAGQCKQGSRVGAKLISQRFRKLWIFQKIRSTCLNFHLICGREKNFDVWLQKWHFFTNPWWNIYIYNIQYL